MPPHLSPLGNQINSGIQRTTYHKWNGEEESTLTIKLLKGLDLCTQGISECPQGIKMSLRSRMFWKVLGRK